MLGNGPAHEKTAPQEDLGCRLNVKFAGKVKSKEITRGVVVESSSFGNSYGKVRKSFLSRRGDFTAIASDGIDQGQD